MDYNQLWNSAVDALISQANGESERNQLELYRTQVRVHIEGNKICFTCNNIVIYETFAVSYLVRAFKEVSSLLGRSDMSVSVEFAQTANQGPNALMQHNPSAMMQPSQAQAGQYGMQPVMQQQSYIPQGQQMNPALMQGGIPDYNGAMQPMQQGYPNQWQGNAYGQSAMQGTMPQGGVAAEDMRIKERREFVSEQASAQAGKSRLAAIEKMFPNIKRRNAINPSKTFENYVIDPENKILFATAVGVASNPGSSNYNPLYIYGGSGLGKTHLLFAIANHIMKTNPDKTIIYTRAEEFIRHYVESMANIKKTPFDDQQVHFQDLYTEHDVFIVDDIQNFIKGPKAREAFFDIIAEFIDKPNRQLILASDVPPGNLNGFNARLTSRFGSGVCCEVMPPGIETRRAITMKKCKEMQINLSEEIANYIAVNIRSNIRELEGAIKTLNSHMQQNEVLTLEDAKRILTNLVNASNQVCSLDTIKERVSREFEVPVAAMESAEKKKTVSLARSMAMSLARDLIPSLSLSDIGRAFNKDHSSVHEAIKRIGKRIQAEPEIASKYNKLTLSLKKE